MSTCKSLLAAAAMLAGLAASSAHASLSTLATFSGEGYGVSTSGCGSVTQRCVLNASVPVGATILKAYLYTSTFNALSGAGGTFAGQAVSYTSLGTEFGLEAGRADVTSFVTGGGSYLITETSVGQHGGALVIVYDDPASTAIRTIGILDGYSATTGDTATISFGTPLDKTIPGFTAEMRLGIGHSFDGDPCGSDKLQTSSVAVNGTTITHNAGCNDDSIDALSEDGNLITVGDDNDLFSPFLPTVEQDHERYNLANQINNGDTSISVRTLNPSNDDNIFLAVFLVSGAASITVPEPMSLALVGLGLAGMAVQRRRLKHR